MDGLTLTQILEVAQNGGHFALLASVYFIYKAADRLARIEKALDIILAKHNIDQATLPPIK